MFLYHRCLHEEFVLALVILLFFNIFIIRVNGKDRHVIVRYDDYSPVTSYRRAANPDVEITLFKLFSKYNATIIVGVLPFANNLNPNNPSTDTRNWLSDRNNPWVMLLRQYVEAGVVELALHGYEHRLNSSYGHRPNEFVDRPIDWQERSIRSGVEALANAFDQKVKIFIPPWNAWNRATIESLKHLKFNSLSGDFVGPPPDGANFLLLPQCKWDPGETLDSIKDEPLVPIGTLVVLVIHPFDLMGSGGKKYFSDLENLLAFVKTSHDWDCNGTVAVKGWESFEPERFRLARTWFMYREILHDIPTFAFLEDRPLFYYTTDWYLKHLSSLQFKVISTFALSFLLSAVIPFWAARFFYISSRLKSSAFPICMILTIFLMVGGVLNFHRGYLISGRRLFAVVLLLGAVIGILLARKRAEQRVLSPSKPPNNNISI